MPKGYKTVSVKIEVHEKIKQLAEETDRSIPELISYLFKKHREDLEKILDN